MNLSMKQKETHKPREQTCHCQGGVGVGEGCIGSLGLKNCKVLSIGWINNEVLLYRTGNYTQ